MFSFDRTLFEENEACKSMFLRNIVPYLSVLSNTAPFYPPTNISQSTKGFIWGYVTKLIFV